jgi:hypothetical protein
MPKIEKRSWTWKYFAKEEDLCKCLRCPYTHKPKQGTTSAMAHHLRVIHKISPDVDEQDSDSDDVVALPGSSSGGSMSRGQGQGGSTSRRSKEEPNQVGLRHLDTLSEVHISPNISTASKHVIYYEGNSSSEFLWMLVLPRNCFAE